MSKDECEKRFSVVPADPSTRAGRKDCHQGKPELPQQSSDWAESILRLLEYAEHETRLHGLHDIADQILKAQMKLAWSMTSENRSGED